MQTSPHQQAPAIDPLVIERAHQDSMIGQRLPTWLRSASVDQLTELGNAMRHSLSSRQLLSAVLKNIQSIDSFATSALKTALKERFGDDYNVQRWKLLTGRREPVINLQPVGAHLTQLVYEEVPLTEAALRNFTVAETEIDGQPRGNRLMSSWQGTIKPPSAIEFAGVCRDIDIGGQYQHYLASIFQPDAGRVPGKSVPELLADSHRYMMLVDAYQARLKAGMRENELQLVNGLCSEGTLGRFDGDPVVAKQLTLLGCKIEQIVVLDVISEGLIRNTTRQVLVHIPGDPHGAWSVFASLRSFANELGRRLRAPSYQRFFSQFVRRRDSQRFFSVVIPAYADLVMTANFDLEEHMYAYPMPLFESLASARIEQIKGDAAMIAVPVAAVDREVQREHDERLAAEGWTLLNLAGLFVPVIGAALLLNTAWELLGQVYHGVEAWRDGDTSEALDHLVNVGSDLAVIAATAAGATVVRRLWSRSTAVDSLIPAHLEDGTLKLWNQDLSPFRNQAPPSGSIRDTLGVYRLGDQAWVEMEGHYYAVAQRATDGRWQLRPVDGHGPLLCHNGVGAWRLWCEQPAEWDDVYRMFRRLGEDFRRLDDEQIDLALKIHGLDGDHLRALHVYAQAPEPELLDSVMRIRLDQRIRKVVSCLRSGETIEDAVVLEHAQELPGSAGMSDSDLAELTWAHRRELFERLYEVLQDSDTADSTVLRRVFPTLSGRAAKEIVRLSSAADRQRLQDSGRVALGMSEAARARVFRIRAARAYEAFVLDTPQNADFARVALGMLKYLPGASTGVRWHLVEGSPDGAQLLSSREGTQAYGLIHLSGKFQLMDAQGSVIGAPGELFEVMANAYDNTRRAAMGIGDPFAQNLKVLLGRLAIQQRQEVEAILSTSNQRSWFRAPLRLAGGRVGYPMGGRVPAGDSRSGRPQALFARVRGLYPSFSDVQVTAWINDVQSSGRLIETELVRLGRELELLDHHLYQWQRLTSVAAERDDRHYFRVSLRNCWQRRLPFGLNQVEQSQSYRFTMYGVRLGDLPEVPVEVSFAHVTELALLEMELQALPDGFLRAFPNLQVLELFGNQLSRLPGMLMQLRSLRELDLVNNQIVLDSAQSTILASCESLEYINLSHNPLGRAFSVSGLTRLRRLHLRGTGITALPNALVRCPDLLLADMRENQITQLSEDFYQAPALIRRSILLANNPLTAAESQRLRESMLEAGALPAEVEGAESNGTHRQRWLDASRGLSRGELSVCWENLHGELRSGDFFDLLGRLLETADFQQNGQALANRVFAMIRAMHDNAGLRDELFNYATQDLTCQDSVALCFSNLELRMMVWRTESAAGNRQDALLHLGRQLWRLEEVDRIALEDIQARRALGNHPDEIEIGLAYRLGLRDALNLPAQPNDMLFERVADVDSQRIVRALARVVEAETPAQVAQSLVARDFWQEHLLRIERARFNAVDAPFHDRLTTVMDSETVTNGARVRLVNLIKSEREEAQRALMLEITLEALQGAPSSSASASS